MDRKAWFCPSCQKHHGPHVDTCPGVAGALPTPAPVHPGIIRYDPPHKWTVPSTSDPWVPYWPVTCGSAPYRPSWDPDKTVVMN